MNQKSIVIIGSLNMDMVIHVPRFPKEGETLAGHDFKVVPGGKGANQAVAAAKLGACVNMIGKVGSDEFGDTMVKNLQDSGVNVSGIQKQDGSNTGIAFINVDQNGKNNIVITAGANAAITEQDIERYRYLIEQSDIVILQLEIPLGVN